MFAEMRASIVFFISGSSAEKRLQGVVRVGYVMLQSSLSAVPASFHPSLRLVLRLSSCLLPLPCHQWRPLGLRWAARCHRPAVAREISHRVAFLNGDGNRAGQLPCDLAFWPHPQLLLSRLGNDPQEPIVFVFWGSSADKRILYCESVFTGLMAM